MHDIEFKVEDVQRFQMETRAIGREIVARQETLLKDLARVSEFWKDDSITLAQTKIAEIDRKMRAALAQLDNVVGLALRRQIEWAERYRRIR